MEISGGEINVRSTHLYDLLRHFGGEVDRVYAAGTDPIGTEEIDDDVVVTSTVEHENGVVSYVSSGVINPRWTVELDLVVNDFELRLHYADQHLEGNVGGDPVEFDGEYDRYRREVETFRDACRDRDQSLVRSSYEDAVRILGLNWAVIEVARTGAPVDLD